MNGPDSAPAARSRDGAPIRLGIAGLGMAGAFMIRAAVTHPKISLAAGADPLPRPRAAFARDFGARTYPEFRALCEDETLEAIYIATPHQLHAEQTVMALSHGKHVIVEKPMALTLADCDAVIEAQERTGLTVIVGHTHGFDANVRQLRQMIRSGAYGRLGMINTFDYTDFLYRARRPDELVTALGGGITFNQVSHQIEIVRHIGGGLVRSVRANVGVLDPSRPTEGNSLAFLEFQEGAAASLIYSGYDFFDSDELHGWIAEGGNPKAATRPGATRETLRANLIAEDERQKDYGYGGRHLPAEQPHMPHFGFLVATCAKADLKISPEGITVYGVEG
ncbi:MAG: Gfo/Idh/MocA family oxidoreductase, partial [Alphaproteobacteria bacterium]|nr:Gfo/Idh/MocA family oxidoreductase [Alphaproteobacteria bacterium]